jgi:hypothetical protein
MNPVSEIGNKTSEEARARTHTHNAFAFDHPSKPCVCPFNKINPHSTMISKIILSYALCCSALLKTISGHSSFTLV